MMSTYEWVFDFHKVISVPSIAQKDTETTICMATCKSAHGLR